MTWQNCGPWPRMEPALARPSWYEKPSVSAATKKVLLCWFSVSDWWTLALWTLSPPVVINDLPYADLHQDNAGRMQSIQRQSRRVMSDISGQRPMTVHLNKDSVKRASKSFLWLASVATCWATWCNNVHKYCSALLALQRLQIRSANSTKQRMQTAATILRSCIMFFCIASFQTNMHPLAHLAEECTICVEPCSCTLHMWIKLTWLWMLFNKFAH